MRRILTVIQIISVIVLVGAYGAFAYMHWQEDKSIQTYQECRTLYKVDAMDNKIENQTTEDNNTGQDSRKNAEIDFHALHEKNKDVIGWITIPGTNIDYPVVQGSNNTHYLKYAYNRKRSWMGSIFIDYRNESDFSDFNTVIYGHELSTKKTMFSQLNKYLSKTFWEKHKEIVIDTDDEEQHTYTVFSVYVSPAKSIAFNPDIEEDIFPAFLQSIKDAARYDTEIEPNADNKIVTLVCCYEKNFSKRVVVHAMQIS
ncbi:class B sortase [Butyricicoccus sp.]|uniref:class B sortase n=1 Tax=Butyricicoccus sp. TaxID=2049021 RepID=UPI003D7CDAB9